MIVADNNFKISLAISCRGLHDFYYSTEVIDKACAIGTHAK